MKILLALLILPLLAFSQAGVDKSAMNTSVNPCVDFYQYACGNWNASHPLPADRARSGRCQELQGRNEKVELEILQAASRATTRPEIDRKIGDYYASCMDTAAIEKQGLGPVKTELQRINAMQTRDQVVAEMARLHRMGVGVVFGFGAAADPKDSNRTI